MRDQEFNFLGTARARVGYAAERTLIYVTGGAAFGNIQTGLNPPATFDSTTRVGWAAGAGLEYAFSGNWSAKAEYLFVDLGTASCTTVGELRQRHRGLGRSHRQSHPWRPQLSFLLVIARCVCERCQRHCDRRGGGHRRRPGRPCQRHRAHPGWRRDNSHRAFARKRPSHDRIACRFGDCACDIGAWEACLPHAAPLVCIRIVDDTRRLLRAPEVTFSAAEIGLEAFGYNIENRHLIAALYQRAAELNISHVAAPALSVAERPRRRHHRARRWRGAGTARRRRRRPAFALPRCGRASPPRVEPIRRRR